VRRAHSDRLSPAHDRAHELTSSRYVGYLDSRLGVGGSSVVGVGTVAPAGRIRCV
jgi:hypothetical protein